MKVKKGDMMNSRYRKLTRAFILLALTFIIVQAAPAKDEPKELKNASVEILDILENESAYLGKMTVIEGKIENECGSGCWFILDDKTASIYVDIKPSNFVIPQKRGSVAKVYGNVSTKDGDLYIIGKIVEIDGEIYQYEKTQAE